MVRKVHRLAAVGHQAGQQAGFPGVGPERREPVPVFGENGQDLVGVQRIALGPAGFEGLAKPGHGGGGDRVEDQEVMLQQRVNQRAAGLLHGHGDRPALETLPQLGHPGTEHLGLLLQGAGFLFGRARRQQTEGMFLIGPIEGQEGREGLGIWIWIWFSIHDGSWLVVKTRWPVPAKGL